MPFAALGGSTVMGKRIRYNRPIIAITGSAGKSTTKEMVASILSTRWHIFKSVDNCNYFTHTRQYATKIRPAHKAVVLEYGMSGAGHIRKHCEAIEPNYAVITNIGSAHIGAFGGDIVKLARAKSELIRWMNPTGTVVLNNDDANTNLINKGRFHGKTITVGIDNPADYQAKNVRFTASGMAFNVLIAEKIRHFTIPIHGKHHVYNALCAIAIADLIGFLPSHIRQGLNRYRRMRRRTSSYRFKRNIVLIDDSYSSNPHAAKAAIDTLAEVGNGTKIAVLGSMRALGCYGAKGHAEVGRYLADKKISLVYTYGRLAKRIGLAAIQWGLPQTNVRHFTSKSKLHHYLLKNLSPNTTILVKGSHGVKMMETADILRSHLSSPYRGQYATRIKASKTQRNVSQSLMSPTTG